MSNCSGSGSSKGGGGGVKTVGEVLKNAKAKIDINNVLVDEFNGNIWHNRIYINMPAWKILDDKSISNNTDQAIKSAKIYYDIDSGIFKYDSSWLTRNQKDVMDNVITTLKKRIGKES